MTQPIRIATRASKLALWQAERVRQSLLSQDPKRSVELVTVQTRGDIDRDRPLVAIGTIGLFTKEIQRAVLSGEADAAVHSLKDLPTEPVDGLCLAAVPPRGPVHDVFLSPRFHTLEALPPHAMVATGSLRRRAQLLRYRRDLEIVDIRGNVETRIGKLCDAGPAGLVLAAAGVQRLGLEAEVTQQLSLEVMLPAVGQGALAVECRDDAADLASLLRQINDPPTRAAVEAERAFLRRLGGGCHVPIAALAEIANGVLSLRGTVLDPDGRQCFSERLSGPSTDSVLIGARLAELLLERGAAAVLGQMDANGVSSQQDC
jgi:hydroxymethylbilane synthase